VVAQPATCGENGQWNNNGVVDWSAVICSAEPGADCSQDASVCDAGPNLECSNGVCACITGFRDVASSCSAILGAACSRTALCSDLPNAICRPVSASEATCQCNVDAVKVGNVCLKPCPGPTTLVDHADRLDYQDKDDSTVTHTCVGASLPSGTLCRLYCKGNPNVVAQPATCGENGQWNNNGVVDWSAVICSAEPGADCSQDASVCDAGPNLECSNGACICKTGFRDVASFCSAILGEDCSEDDDICDDLPNSVCKFGRCYCDDDPSVMAVEDGSLCKITA